MDDGNDSAASIQFRTREILPKYTYVSQVENGTFFYFTYTSYWKAYVKYEGKEIDAKLPAGIVVVDIGRSGVHGNSVFFECAAHPGKPDRKVYCITFTAPDTLDITYVRDRLENEEVFRYAMCLRSNKVVDDGGRVRISQSMYRLQDDPERDAIVQSMGPNQGISTAVIHRKSVIYIRQRAGEYTTTVERNSLNNIVVQIPYTPHYVAAFSQDSSNFFYLTNGIALFTVNLETMTVLPTLKIGKIPFRYITGIHNGVLTLMDDEKEWRLFSALLPDGYHVDDGKSAKSDRLTAKFKGIFIKNHSITSTKSHDWLSGNIIEEEPNYIREGERSQQTFTAEQIQKILVEIVPDKIQPKSTEFVSKFFNDFIFRRIRGKGGFGCVFEVVNKVDKFEYAVKRIAVSKNKLDEDLTEVYMMATLDHPGIVRYNCTWIEEPPAGWQNHSDFEKLNGMQSYFKDDDVFIYIQMQLYKNSLYDWLEANQTELSRDPLRIKLWFKEIVTAVQYLHDHNIIHSDLKPANILLDDKDRVKLCDLGISTDRNIENGVEITVTRNSKFSPIYSSPEQMSVFTRFSSKTDVFALGLIFAELSFVMTPDERRSIFDDYRHGTPLHELFESNTADFIAWLANAKSKDRPRCIEILLHPFLAI